MTRSAPSERRYNGVTYDSQAERKRAEYLDALRAAGHVRLWIRQPIFDLGGVVYRPDFLVLWRNGGDVVNCGRYDEEFKEWHREHLDTVVFEEVKPARMHPDVLRRFVRNQKQVLELHGVLVALVRVK